MDLRLLNLKPEQLKQLVDGITGAVTAARRRHPLRAGGGMTRHEERRRAQWCVEQAVELFRARLWPIERIVDTLPHALDGYLRDGSWQPDEGAGWAPGDLPTL